MLITIKFKIQKELSKTQDKNNYFYQYQKSEHNTQLKLFSTEKLWIKTMSLYYIKKHMQIVNNV